MSNQTSDPMHEQLWRIQDVAEFLSLAPSAVYRARKEHGLPTVRIGGTLRFRPTSVRAWATERESTDGVVVKAAQPRELELQDVQPRGHERQVPVKLLD